MFNKKPKSGWENFKSKSKPKTKKNNDGFFSNVFIKPIKQNRLLEKIIKFLIYISLKIVISTKKWKQNIDREKEVVNTTYDKVKLKEFKFIPAGLGMYLFIAFMPILTIVFTIISFNDSWASFLIDHILVKVVPGVSNSIPEVKGLFSSNNGTIALVVLFISSLWISSKGVAIFINVQGTIYGQKNVEIFLVNRLRAIMVVLCIPLYISLNLSIYIPTLIWFKLLMQNVNPLYYNVVFYVFTLICFFITTFIGFLLLFKFSPRFKVKFKHIYPGAFISTITITIFFLLFGSIISIAELGKTYGAIGTFMYLTTLLFYSAFFVFIGVVTNASYYNAFISKKIINKGIGSRKKII